MWPQIKHPLIPKRGIQENLTPLASGVPGRRHLNLAPITGVKCSPFWWLHDFWTFFMQWSQNPSKYRGKKQSSYCHIQVYNLSLMFNIYIQSSMPAVSPRCSLPYNSWNACRTVSSADFSSTNCVAPISWEVSGMRFCWSNSVNKNLAEFANFTNFWAGGFYPWKSYMRLHWELSSQPTFCEKKHRKQAVNSWFGAWNVGNGANYIQGLSHWWV